MGAAAAKVRGSFRLRRGRTDSCGSTKGLKGVRAVGILKDRLRRSEIDVCLSIELAD